MTRRGPDRLPGDPPAGDRDFGPLGGLADDVIFWQKDRERRRAVSEERLATLSPREAVYLRLMSRIRAWLLRRAREDRG